MTRFYYKSTCSTCRTARKLLQSLGATVEERDMSREPLTAEELRVLVGERDVTPFLNPRNEDYRARGLKQNPPSRDEAIALMAANANLVRRPLLVTPEETIFGWDEAAYRRLLG